MYKVTKAFIYRAKLYAVGQELTDNAYQRMLRDKVAAKRGVPDMVAPQGREPAPGQPLEHQLEHQQKVEFEHEQKVEHEHEHEAKKPAKKPGRKPKKT